MDIFIINTEKANFVPGDLLQEFGYKTFSNKQKEKTHRFAYLMFDRILRNFYHIENPTLSFENEKPALRNKEKNFSISHSGGYIALAFSDYGCGIDIEQVKARDYQKISERMGFESISLKDFYLNWTEYEAKYKLGQEAKSAYSFEIPNYTITAVSMQEDEKFEVYYNL